MKFSRQEYWSGLPVPSPGDLPNPGIESRSPALQADSLHFGKESACSAGDLDLIAGLEDPLEKGKATCSSILAWKIPWTVLFMGSQSQTRLSNLHFHFTFKLTVVPDLLGCVQS